MACYKESITLLSFFMALIKKRTLSGKLLNIFSYIYADVSKERAASIFSVEELIQERKQKAEQRKQRRLIGNACSSAYPIVRRWTRSEYVALKRRLNLYETIRNNIYKGYDFLFKVFENSLLGRLSAFWQRTMRE